ncbi:MerR family transcriptional regulator [Streptosporangium canum]|uniref:MerR family transcriptional regulator n=1 Tax=Streptosporangium canum TaxID=324952 RepID=UPI00369DB07F
MRISAVARETGVSQRLLRYYEEQGLLRPVRLANGYREYTESDVTTVRHIRSLLTAGLTTDVIAQLLHCVHDDGDRLVPSACPGMIGHLERERARTTEAITRLQVSQQALDVLLTAALRQPAVLDGLERQAPAASPRTSPPAGDHPASGSPSTARQPGRSIEYRRAQNGGR